MLDLLEDPNQLDQNIAIGLRSDNLRFITANVDFFDLFYNDKLSDIVLDIKYTNKDIYFRDVTIFINRIKNITYIKDTKLTRVNL